MKRRLLPLFVAIPCFFPAVWRLITRSLSEPVGLCSDLGLGLVLFAVVWFGPRWLRVLLLLTWSLFQVMSMELLAAVGRLPSWQDVHYLLDPTFLENSSAGLHLAEPVFALLFLASAVLAVVVPVQRLGGKRLAAAAAVGIALVLQANFSASHANQTIAARYNPLHWFVNDALFRSQPATSNLTMADMPPSFATLDLQGKSLLGAGRVKNVLIVVLEGLVGIYNPEIRRQMGVADGPYQMVNLAEATETAMLIPDFVTHSHQTIRGLYAIHCGDISKLSYDTPKGMELQSTPERAGECLPARLANQGWDTHFLQGAPLQFMNKDTVMPAMGFQNVHGLEWFTERKEKEFIWGTTDEDFFLGARKYVQKLRQQDKPWLLSLLTVATHQPFDAPEDMIKKYGNRKIAAVARLDTAAAQFLNSLREDGILEDTLVIVTSDESHGYEGPDWYSSWGYMAVMAPGQETLPRLKAGTYGLMDIEASILDYLELPMPPSIIGRSFFRDYSSGREMASYTSGKLRWQTADNKLYECSADGNCYVSDSAGVLYPRPDKARRDENNSAARLFGLGSLLDHKLTVGMRTQSLQFGHGEIRPLPDKIRNEWVDNLVGAQYLDFPKDSRVDVDIRLKAVTAEEAGVQMKLVMRQFEIEVKPIAFTPCPLLKTGEECHIKFAFDNPEARKAFSFHLVGEGKNSSIQLQNFEVTINRGADEDG